MPGISAVIIAKDEEQHIGRCLESLQGVADEIVVVLDNESRDRTEAICIALGAQLIHSEWKGFTDTKNFAKAQAKHPYILSLDADEALSEELRAAILNQKEDLSGAYRFKRRNYYCGQWIRYAGWYPDTKLRLAPAGQSQWTGGQVHESLQVDPGIPVSELKGDLLHYTIDSIGDHLARVNRYSTLAAQKMYERGESAGWLKMRIKPLVKFLKMYILHRGFLDGYKGFLVCRISAWSYFLRYAKLKELYENGKQA